MNKIIALWTHPRTISTAFERVMMERGDMKILHEPFSYHYYVFGENASIPQEFEDPDHPRTYPEIRDMIVREGEENSIFFKDMCAHCDTELVQDDQFLKRLTNTFLIRDPAKAIASYYAMNQDVTSQEIGLAQVARVFDRIREVTGEMPVVIDADDLENDPEGTVKAYSEAAGIPFMPESLTWEAEHKPEWDIWKKWHADAAKSTGIQKNMETFAVTIDNSDHLRAYYEEHLPHYEKLYRHRVKR